MNVHRHAWLVAAAGVLACTAQDRAVSSGLPALPDGVQAISLLGDTLRTPEIPPDTRREYEANLREAQANHERNPEDADAIVWLGRRTAYLGRYREAVEIYTQGIAQHPDDARLYRHRGHRYITVRLFEQAVEDLAHAAELVRGTQDEVEPDGIPNARNTPTSTLQSNIWYHLGLAHYLRGEFDRALAAYRECLAVSNNPDMLVATSHWLYMTLRRLGREAEAARVLEPIHAGLDVIENQSYHRLLLMYKGGITADSLMTEAASGDALQNATLAYGVGNYHLYHGRSGEAARVFQRIVGGPQWAAFGYIAAEAELGRMRARTGD